MAGDAVIGRSLPGFGRGREGQRADALRRRRAAPRHAHARLVLSPHAHARIVRIDASAAAAVPGMVAVLSARDLPLPKLDPSDRNRCPLALETRLAASSAIASVWPSTATTGWPRKTTRSIEYEELPASVDPLEAMQPDAPVVALPGAGDDETAELAMHDAVTAGAEEVEEPRPPNVASAARFHRGDVWRGFADADVVVERRYRTSMVHQGYLEPRAAVASVDALAAPYGVSPNSELTRATPALDAKLARARFRCGRMARSRRAATTVPSRPTRTA